MTYEVGKRMRDAEKWLYHQHHLHLGPYRQQGAAHEPVQRLQGGLNHFTRCMAVELGQYGIRVNAIAPGYTNSDLSHFIPKEEIDYIITRCRWAASASD
jgi:NAD(P)-dependent dehydrogenase (short-subunit alcohol dehydrogenase family)